MVKVPRFQERRHPALAGPFSFEHQVQSWSRSDLQRWLARGLAAYTSTDQAVQRHTAFWPAVIHPEEDLAHEIMACIERVPGKLPDFADVVCDTIALWTLARGEPAMLHLLALARMIRAPDLPRVLRYLIFERPFGEDREDSLLSACVELACQLGPVSGSRALLDDIRQSERIWRDQYAPGWLRAMVRSGDIDWVEGLQDVRGSLCRLSSGGFPIQRFLDRLLDDLPGMHAVISSLERYVLGTPLGQLQEMSDSTFWQMLPNRKPWFFELLFDGDNAPLRPSLIGEDSAFRRVRRYTTPDPPILLRHIGIDLKPQYTVALLRNRLWDKLLKFKPAFAAETDPLPSALSPPRVNPIKAEPTGESAYSDPLLGLLATSFDPFFAGVPARQISQVSGHA